MRDVSFILTGRDDGYAGNFIERFQIALKKNLEILSRYDLDYEIIVVDYNPLNGKLLKDNEYLKDLLNHPRVRNIIIDRSVIIADELPENGFYEYFGKNCGAIKSEGEFLFMTNADIIISNDIVEYIKELSGYTRDDRFYRLRYRQDIHNGMMVGEAFDLYMPEDEDSGPICGIYSGDATIFSRKVFNEISTGYNEMDDNHRTINGQASMDSEILWNLLKKGINMQLVALPYYHVWHQRQAKDSGLSKDSYTNRSGWGYSNYSTRNINYNTIEVYA